MIEGKIVKINSDIHTVEYENILYDCKVRGKVKYLKTIPLVGDKVLFNKDELIIEKILDRVNYLERPPVSNIDYNLIITSLKKPDFNDTLLDKLITISYINNIDVCLIFSKYDLLNSTEKKKYKKIIKYYKSIGYKVFYNTEIRKIKRLLKNKIVTVSGQTGSGKSTFINKFDKNLNLDTNEISEALGRGKHTTRIVEAHKINNFYIIDTPGFSKLDIDINDTKLISNSFVEFPNNCLYKDCKHIKEKGCSVINNKNILESRYNNYIRFISNK